MSGKKAQRTKGNTQASSSSRAAKFLQNEGQAGLISFSGLTSGASGIGDVNSLDAELRLLLRKMAKKDTITKLKAVQEFTLLCKEKDGEAIKSMLNFWPRMYNKLSHDFDHRVRECTQQAHYQLTTKAGRNLAPFLKQIIVNWLMSQFDIHSSAASNAKSSFDEVFQEKKRKEVLLFCKTEILQACEKNILKETADTLSDPKVVSLEEREAKYNRFISSTFLLLKYLLENLQCNDEDVSCSENLKILFADKKFWKFAKHDSPLIRCSFYHALLTFCELLPLLMKEYLEYIGPTVLTNVDEKDAAVTKALWNVLLYCLSNFKNIWQFVNPRKAVWPKLWKLMNAGCYGNINIVYPNLLPFISYVTPEVAGDGTGFYAEFFSHIGEIFTSKRKVLSDNEINLVMSSYMECIRCLLTKSQNKELCDFIIWTLIADLLHNIFHTAEEYHGKYRGVFLKELNLLLSFLYKESDKYEEHGKNYKSLYMDLWKVVSVVVFIKSDNDIRFKVIKSDSDTECQSQPSFYKSLTDFISYCSDHFCMKSTCGDEISSSNELGIDEPYKRFIHDIIKCYIEETFGQQRYAVGEDIIKMVCFMSLDLEVLKLICIEKLSREKVDVVTDATSNVDICKQFVKSVCLPLLTVEVQYQKAIVEVIIGVASVLSGSEKQEYLVTIFETDLFCGTLLLELIAEVFRFSSNEYVLQWLKSDFVEKKIMEFCSVEKGDEPWNAVQLKWQILRNYVQIVQDDEGQLSIYHNKLLVLIKYCIESGEQSSKATHDAVLTTFVSLCTPSFEISKPFQEALFAIFHHNVYQAETKSSLDAMNKGMVLLMDKPQNMGYFKEFLSKLTAFLKESCIDLVNSAKLCTVLCSLLQLSQAYSKETYGKVILEEILDKLESIHDQDEIYSCMVRFTSKFLQTISGIDGSLLQMCCEKKLISTTLKCVSHGEKIKDNHINTDIKECIRVCEFIHFNLVDEAVHRCLLDNLKTDAVKEILLTLLDSNTLSESILDHILMLSAPSKHNYMNLPCNTYCMIISIVNDISCIRALVEMYVDELRNNGDVSDNASVFGQFIKVLSAVTCRWYDILKTLDADLEDYCDIVHIIVKNIITWKDGHSEMLLFSTSLTEANPSTISLNINLIQILCQYAHTAVEIFKGDLWDFLLCSMISWIQTCEESIACLDAQSSPQFIQNSFRLFNKIACVFDSCPVSNESSTRNILPCIYLKDQSPSSVPPLSDDVIAEWKEFFLPTASASLLRIYMELMRNNDDSSLAYTELEQIVSCCIRFVPPYTIHESVCSGHEGESEQRKALEEFYNSCCQVLATGKWWSKIGCYQLLTGLGESIEGKLCYISQLEDEDHEGMRSFPSPLIQTMENSRDETLKALSLEEVSIKDPLTAFENPKGKSDLLTYILSWQLMLQLFKMADPSNRALFANYFHNNSDIHDLITCLFCLMPQSINMENMKKITLTNFTFPEIRQIAFHLLTTAMECIPALMRNWFNNHVNRVDAGTVNKFVSNFISPLLLKNEFKNLNESSKEFNNMVVKTRASAREIAAVYTVDEVSMELVVQLGQNHPLSPVSVTCGKRIGVSNSLWRQWMLQLNTFLSFQNGSILDGLALWKRNVDKRFEGVEECMVCFSVLHGSNYSLPTIACKTCKKKFHPACLYKWFNTSGKCTCPLCRNVF